MTVEVIKIESEQQWLGERVKDITSTEVSALYGLSPYKTEFELFHEKRDGQVIKFQPNERMKWGTRLESIIAQGAAEENGWEIEPLKVYMRDMDVRIGSSFDFEIKSSANGRGILEIKNVDSLQYMRNWIDDGAGNIEAPEHIEMQIQHQMEVAGYDWTALVALVGGNELKVVYRNRDREIGADIRAKVTAFWDRVKSNTPPSADYSKDADFIIKQLYGKANEGEILDATNDPAIGELLKQYRFVSSEVSGLEAIKDSYKAQILEKIGTASKVLTPYGSLSCGMVKDSVGTLITADMVGTYSGARKGYRSFRFTPKKDQ